MRRRELITLLGGGGYRMAACGVTRSRRESFRPSGSWAQARLRPGASGPPLLCSGCANSAGSRGEPLRSSIAGRRGAASAMPRSRPSSSRLKVDVIVTVASRQSSRRKTGDIGHPDRLRGRRWTRLATGLVAVTGATGRKRHRPVDSVHRTCRQATRTFARGAPRSPPVGDHGQCRLSRRCGGDGRGSGGCPQAWPRRRRVRNPACRGYRAGLRGAQERGCRHFMCVPTRS